jgi:aminoglycoside phosphotransferase
MPLVDNDPLQTVLTWCADLLGPFTRNANHTRERAGLRTSTIYLATLEGGCYVKMHRTRSYWENEVHAYERWALAFGDYAPRLLAVRDVEPLALVISALPGQALEHYPLGEAQEQAVWHDAGRALAALHSLGTGEGFGTCHRDGSPIGPVMTDACAYLTQELDGWLERDARGRYLREDDLAVVQSARRLIPAFAGERPIPCHRDYCPANWLVSEAGVWTGVIDFEFAYWDVRTADFARDPFWNWITRPMLQEALTAGYGLTFTPMEEQQLLFSRALYALGAVVWGEENEYHVYAREGRLALKVVGEMLKKLLA